MQLKRIVCQVPHPQFFFICLHAQSDACRFIFPTFEHIWNRILIKVDPQNVKSSNQMVHHQKILRIKAQGQDIQQSLKDKLWVALFSAVLFLETASIRDQRVDFSTPDHPLDHFLLSAYLMRWLTHLGNKPKTRHYSRSALRGTVFQVTENCITAASPKHRRNKEWNPFQGKWGLGFDLVYIVSGDWENLRKSCH